ncbi:MAG: hypothetical protein N2234_05540 [Planctomycetota bacterium]|nr:hypothetical protein [Planctomycetota bacterium]
MEYKIERAGKRCEVCETSLPDKDGKWFSAIKESAREFVRLEFCGNCFEKADKSGLFSFWKRKAKKGGTKIFFDSEGASQLFYRILEQDEHKELLYVLSILLLRKHILKLLDILEEGGKKFVILSDRAGKQHKIEEPPISAEKMAELKENLLKLFQEV